MSIVSGFKFNKNLGQNFILDEGFLGYIVKELRLSPEDTVVEIGTGAGTLTRVLAKHVKKVVTYEVDKRLAEILEKQFKGITNIDLRFADGLKAEINEGRYLVVANIPYYITTSLIMKFMADNNCSRICVLVQDDVARRIVALHGGKDYGALSVGLQAAADCRILQTLKRGCFVPAPEVDSAFVVIDKKNNGVKIPERFLKSIFSARRKTILNALGIDKDAARKILAEVGIDESLRPEQVTVEQFINLTSYIYVNKLV